MFFRQNNITNGRFELKYIANSSNFFLIERWIKQNFHPINIAFPKRKIHNLYFDNLDLECYEDNLSGISKRSKLRFRWFGNLGLVNNGTLEIKKKESSIGFKNRLQIKEKFSFKNKKWRDIKKIIKSNLQKNPEFDFFFDFYFMPILINSYEREYYHIKGVDMRVTIDNDYKVFPQLQKSRVNTSSYQAFEELRIIEIKFPVKNLKWVKSLIEGLPILRTRSSKYVIGLEALL